MGKRRPTSDINHDNWDDPEEPEEAGTFKACSQSELQSRPIKTAKRRIKPDTEGGTKPIFAAFTGFKTSSSSTSNATSSTKSFGFLQQMAQTTNGTQKTEKPTEVTPQQKYLANLQELNRSVSDWIKKHVDSNPVCILTPIFNDYEKYLKELQNERDTSEKESSAPVSSTPASLSTFSFTNSNKNDNKFTINVPSTVQEENKKTFTFTDTNLVKKTPETTTPMFGKAKDGTGKSPLLQEGDSNKTLTASIFSSFKSSSTSSSLLTKPDPASLMVNPFTSVLNKDKQAEGVKPDLCSNGSQQSSGEKNEEEESDEPPKVEFTPIQEEGAVFSSRCKVFVKKDNNYKDRGVGTLFIKKVKEDKYQLLVRAETVLGNILLNVLLSSSIPTQRMGKNNVMLVCLPTPQDPPPPTTVLLRVKTADEADSLLSTINQYKM